MSMEFLTLSARLFYLASVVLFLKVDGKFSG